MSLIQGVTTGKIIRMKKRIGIRRGRNPVPSSDRGLSLPPDEWRLSFQMGPARVGRNHPTRDVPSHAITAMTRALTQPMLYRNCRATSQTTPPMNAAI